MEAEYSAVKYRRNASIDEKIRERMRSMPLSRQYDVTALLLISTTIEIERKILIGILHGEDLKQLAYECKIPLSKAARYAEGLIKLVEEKIQEKIWIEAQRMDISHIAKIKELIDSGYLKAVASLEQITDSAIDELYSRIFSETTPK